MIRPRKWLPAIATPVLLVGLAISVGISAPIPIPPLPLPSPGEQPTPQPSPAQPTPQPPPGQQPTPGVEPTPKRQPPPARPPVQRPPQAPTDRRAAQIRSVLEQQGVRVADVGVVRGTGFFQGSSVSVWWVDAFANYAQPNSDAMGALAGTIWAGQYSVLGREPSATILSAGQVWTKYEFIFQTRLGNFATLLTRLQGAGTDDERQRAINVFVRSVRFRVFDLERRQFVDDKDFVNKTYI